MSEPYRIVVVGSADDLTRVNAPLAGGPDQFEVELDEPGSDGLLAAEAVPGRPPDVAVIGAEVARPLPVARQLRDRSPKSQIVFLLPPDRIERFRASLPFVPHLASSWTANLAAAPATLGGLIRDAARASRERAATRIVLGRINRQLEAGRSAPAQARRSQLALSERYLATILTQSPDAFVALDRRGAVIAHNDAAPGLFGPALHRKSASALALFPPEERDGLQQLLERAGRGETFSGVEVRLGTAEARSHAELSLAPVHDEAGAIASISITARDISERKRAEERQRLLIMELNHRVKNTLAIVQGLAHQSFKGAKPLAEEREAFSSRLAALAAAHNLLTRQTWQSVPVQEVVESALRACGAPASQLTLRGPAVLLAPQTAVSLAMALHELCTNAIKYGALTTREGHIAAVWDVGDGMLRLEWTESGGPPVEAPAKRGFGTRLLERALAAELGARVKLDFRTSGVVCAIEAPLPDPGA